MNFDDIMKARDRVLYDTEYEFARLLPSKQFQKPEIGREMECQALGGDVALGQRNEELERGVGYGRQTEQRSRCMISHSIEVQV